MGRQVPLCCSKSRSTKEKTDETSTAALKSEGRTVEDIAARFGVTELLVKKRLAIANLIDPVLNAYRKEQIDAP